MPGNAYLAMSFQQKLGLVFGAFVFIAILAGFVVLSKRMSGGPVLSGRRIKVIDRMMLTRDSSILLVRVGLRILAVGVGKGVPSLLCELSPKDFPEFAAKPEESPKEAGFWNRFARNMKSGLTGGSISQTEEDASFAAVLQQIAEKDPVSGAENAGDAGYPLLWEEEQRPAPPKFKRSGYQASIENMTRLSEPDALDRRSHQQQWQQQRERQRQRAAAPGVRFAGAEAPMQPPPVYAPPMPPPPAPEPPAPAVSDEERSGRIDQLLDMIAQRQSRMDNRDDTGDVG